MLFSVSLFLLLTFTISHVFYLLVLLKCFGKVFFAALHTELRDAGKDVWSARLSKQLFSSIFICLQRDVILSFQPPGLLGNIVAQLALGICSVALELRIPVDARDDKEHNVKLFTCPVVRASRIKFLRVARFEEALSQLKRSDLFFLHHAP